MAVQSIDEHKNATTESSYSDSAQTWNRWSFRVLIGALALGGVGKLLIFLWHGLHAAKLTGLACHYFGFCN
jgi:hypothetical protein